MHQQTKKSAPVKKICKNDSTCTAIKVDKVDQNVKWKNQLDWGGFKNLYKTAKGRKRTLVKEGKGGV